MSDIFILPRDISVYAYTLINSQVKQESPLNIRLIFDKYTNKFVTGYLEDQNWYEGKQSEIKREVYLLKKERVEILEKLKNLRNKRITVREGRRTEQRKLSELVDPIIRSLEECDIDNSIDRLDKIIRKIQNRNTSEELEECLRGLSKIGLSLPLYLIDNSLYATFCNRMKSVLDDLKLQEYAVREDIFKLNWRLIIDLGAASVYETSLLFHRNYSVPYIPGSAVKGVTRHWAIQKFAEKIQGDKNAIEKVSRALERGENLRMEVDGIKFEELIKIFGTQNQKGKVIFFDALPVIEQNKDFIVLDVMNVHYKPYYEASEVELMKKKEKAPGDWHSPTPIFFLAVEKGTKFRFALASKDKDSELADKAMDLLKEALKNLGIGAKTSVGYGYFEV